MHSYMWHYVEVSGRFNVPFSLPPVKETQACIG